MLATKARTKWRSEELIFGIGNSFLVLAMKLLAVSKFCAEVS